MTTNRGCIEARFMATYRGSTECQIRKQKSIYQAYGEARLIATFQGSTEF